MDAIFLDRPGYGCHTVDPRLSEHLPLLAMKSGLLKLEWAELANST